VFFCGVVYWILHVVESYLAPPVPILCFVDNLDDCKEKKQSFGSFGEGVLCAVLRAVVVNCQK